MSVDLWGHADSFPFMGLCCCDGYTQRILQGGLTFLNPYREC